METPNAEFILLCKCCLQMLPESAFKPRKQNGKEYSNCYCLDCSRAISRQYYKLTREKAIQLLGGKCVKCGFSDIRALQVDHVHSDGALERSLNSVNIFLRVAKGNTNGRYQLLCANCNAIKRTELEEHPHRKPGFQPRFSFAPTKSLPTIS